MCYASFYLLRLFVVFLYMVLFSHVHFKKMEKDYLWNTTHFMCQTKNPLCEGVDSINSTSQLCSTPKETAPYNVMVVFCFWENPLSARHSIITQHFQHFSAVFLALRNCTLKCCGGALFVRESSQCKRQHHYSTSSFRLWRSPRNIPTSYLTIVTTPELFWISPKNICCIFVTFTNSDHRMKCAMLSYKE